MLVARKGHIFESSDDLDSAKNVGGRNVGDRNVGDRNVATHLAESKNIIDESKNIKLREDHQAARRGSYPSPVREGLTVSEDEVQLEAWASPRLLGGLEDGFSSDLEIVDDESQQAVADVASDVELKSRIRTATRGRVAQDLLSPAGMYAVRLLAAFVMVMSDNDGNPYDAAGAGLRAWEHR